MNEENTSWTSVDLYYDGFHIKKSFPENVKLEALIKSIENAKELGFQPSWNQDTNKQLTQSTAPVDPNTPMCGVHNVPMTQRPAGVSKTTNKPYPAFWACPNKMPDGSFCKFKPQKKQEIDPTDEWGI